MRPGARRSTLDALVLLPDDRAQRPNHLTTPPAARTPTVQGFLWHLAACSHNPGDTSERTNDHTPATRPDLIGDARLGPPDLRMVVLLCGSAMQSNSSYDGHLRQGSRTSRRSRDPQNTSRPTALGGSVDLERQPRHRARSLQRDLDSPNPNSEARTSRSASAAYLRDVGNRP